MDKGYFSFHCQMQRMRSGICLLRRYIPRERRICKKINMHLSKAYGFRRCINLSIGTESIKDILADLDQALRG